MDCMENDIKFLVALLVLLCDKVLALFWLGIDVLEADTECMVREEASMFLGLALDEFEHDWASVLVLLVGNGLDGRMGTNEPVLSLAFDTALVVGVLFFKRTTQF